MPFLSTALVAIAAFLLGAWIVHVHARTRIAVLAARLEAAGGVGPGTAPGMPTGPSINELIQPITTMLDGVARRLDELDRGSARSAGQLVGQMHELRLTSQALGARTDDLTRALRQPQGRGQWGEMQLRRVVELAGMSEHCGDFQVQKGVAGAAATAAAATVADGRQRRPDMVVRLPNGRAIVVDSKTPLDAYMDVVAAPDDDAAAEHLERHARQVAQHVRDLAGKRYDTCVDGALPELVICFLPGEHLFSAALRVRPTLIEDAWKQGVVVASPTTLLTLLHAVAQGWREERIARSAGEISQLGRELHARLQRFSEHLGRVGRHLDQASGAYNDAVGALERRVLVQARRFEELGAASSTIDELVPADVQVRRIS